MTKCEMCGKDDDCNPAGPKGENACFDCAKKNPDALAEFMAKKIISMGSQKDVLVVHADSKNRDKAAKEIANAIREIISRAYDFGVWVQEVKTERIEDGLEIFVEMAVQKNEEEKIPEGKPSPEVAKSCDT